MDYVPDYVLARTSSHFSECPLSVTCLHNILTDTETVTLNTWRSHISVPGCIDNVSKASQNSRNLEQLKQLWLRLVRPNQFWGVKSSLYNSSDPRKQTALVPLSLSLCLSLFSPSLFVSGSLFLFGIRIWNIIAVLNKDVRTAWTQGGTFADAADAHWDIHTPCPGSSYIIKMKTYFQIYSHVYSMSSTSSY